MACNLPFNFNHRSNVRLLNILTNGVYSVLIPKDLIGSLLIGRKKVSLDIRLSPWRQNWKIRLIKTAEIFALGLDESWTYHFQLGLQFSELSSGLIILNCYKYPWTLSTYLYEEYLLSYLKSMALPSFSHVIVGSFCCVSRPLAPQNSVTVDPDSACVSSGVYTKFGGRPFSITSVKVISTIKVNNVTVSRLCLSCFVVYKTWE